MVGKEVIMVVLTGDTHRVFGRIFEFCEEYETTPEDIIVILGDSGINYYLDSSDEQLKKELSALNATLFLVHGNHEERPYNISNYKEMLWHGSMVYYEEEYPNLLFAMDGEIYDFNEKKALVIGGAYSVDKSYRLSGGMPWFDSEQPDDYIKSYVESQLDRMDWKVNYVFSHTVPLSYMPREAFLPNINSDFVDKSTEEWLETIEKKLNYERWFAGHYHIDWNMYLIQILFEDYLELDTEYWFEEYS
jgi:hypothetical protein